ncbi:MAG: MtrB/PioB family outer membrane beta-barrel protein, partial [Acidobacteriota bacterium]|nr:MtrB/PioB family outer membrane beta-barrel protein [Acidobacteriota bacterium]
IQPDRRKPILRISSVFIACVISALLFAPHAWAQTTQKEKTKPKKKTPPKIHTIVEVGAQTRDTQGGHPAKFQEVRDVPKGIFVQKLGLDLNSADSPYSLSLRGFELRERDQRISADWWRIGKFRTQFVWDQVPHSFGTGRSFLVRTSPGYYSVSPLLRASLQAVTKLDADPNCNPKPNCQRTLPNDPLPTLVRQELQTAPLTDVRLRRDQAIFRQSYQPSEKFELHVQFSWLRNNGTRPMSAGTFVRRNVPANGLPDIGGIWEGIGQEFLEPIDQRTYNLNLGVQFRGKKWAGGVDYNLSLFRNHITSLTFENPFRVTDEQGCVPIGNPPLLTCGATNRFRQVHWQNALPPNNDSHTITLWGHIDLRPQTQLRGIFSLAYWTQNDPFLPWTLNTAIVPTLWDNQSPITNPTDVNQLPARSLNGKMRNINQEYALVNRRGNFRFQAQYRSQSLDNQSPTIVFPGYAAFGDSTWRAPRTDFYNLRIENLDWDFRRQNIDAGFQWDLLPGTSKGAIPGTEIVSDRTKLTWRLDYDWEIWNRKFRDVNRNNQHSIRNQLDFEFNFSGKNRGAAPGTSSSGAAKASGAAQGAELSSITTLRLKLDYTYANRRARAYNTQPLTFCPSNSNNPALQCPPVTGGPPANSPQGSWVVTSFTQMNQGMPIEFNLLRRFDETGRIRHDGTLTMELMKGERTDLTASYRYLGDEYDKNFYGLLFNRFSFIDAQLTHTFKNGSYLYATYSRETNHYMYRDLAHLLPAPAAPPGAVVQGTLAQYPIANTWERASRNSLDSFEFGINAAPQKGALKKWEFDLEYALSFARDRITTANPFPVRADSILHAGANPYPDTVVRRHDVNIVITRRIREDLEVGVRYWYEPYTQDDFSYNVLSPYVHGQLTSDTPKYLFQDARYGSYHANVASVFLRFRF